ncbi:hypothetical protein G7054_g1546 [Neopestalotiopsis clavispora]|nr:hypothetical protein G7054_g1546 [Neopestalotiopsis clavispora]
MVALHRILILGSWVAVAATQSATEVPASQSTACGAIVNDPDDKFLFNASLAYECLTSVPFNAAVATKFIKYFNDTLSFHSTLAYLKDPPLGYQQPGTDLMAGLHQLQHLVDSRSFANQYEFEAALQMLLYSAHDGHLYLQAGILAVFTFASPFDIVSLSLDGVQLPKVYRQSDVIDSDSFRTFEPSAIKTINGQDATIYLESFATNNSVGSLEPHTDWNQLMWSPAQDILGYFNVYRGGTTFYPGDTTTIEHENGTSYTEKNLAVYWSQGPTGPLMTGGDFYNFFVLGFYPASFDDALDTGVVNDTDSSTQSYTATTTASVLTVPEASPLPTTPLSWNSPAYPTPDVAQPDLGESGGGYISGYFFSSESFAVLSIPSFDQYGDSLETWPSTIDQFISKSLAAGLERVVIDLQQNSGGQLLLALDTFQRFFPDIAPFSGSRLRAQHAADVMGRTLTAYFQSLASDIDLYSALIDDEWVATTRINVDTQRNFTSWDEFFGPHVYNNDDFTTTQQYNLSNPAFIKAAFDSDASSSNGNLLPEHDDLADPPYGAENIILLTDGTCGSSCAIFSELMHYYGGVRIVTVGGQPRTGPMQGASGSRGARWYDTAALDVNIDFVQQLLARNPNDSSDLTFLPNRTEALDVFVVEATVNLRDQIRPGGTTPLQFLYDAADCRIFFTPQTVANMSALWHFAAEAAWSNDSLCVAGSTGYAITAASSTNGNESVNPAPTNRGSSFDLIDYFASLGNTTMSPDDSSSFDGPLIDDWGPVRGNTISNVKKCKKDGDCKSREACVYIKGCSSSQQDKRCIHTCTQPTGWTCKGGVPGKCTRSAGENSDSIQDPFKYWREHPGICYPDRAQIQACADNNDGLKLSGFGE